MQVDAGALDRERALEHGSRLPFAFVPLLLLILIHHVVVGLISSTIVDKSDLMTIDGQLFIVVDLGLLINLKESFAHGEDTVFALKTQL